MSTQCFNPPGTYCYLTKKFPAKISYAHRAQNDVYEDFTLSKCALPHGHNASLEISVRSAVKEETGMMVEFGKVKEIVNELIIDKWDHAFLVHKEDKETLSYIEELKKFYKKHKENYCDKHSKFSHSSTKDPEDIRKDIGNIFEQATPFKLILFDEPTSVENLTKHVWNILNDAFKPFNIELIKVVFEETPTSICTIEKR